MKYSILVPVYNVERYLPQCLDSLVGQTFRDFEVILADDGSTDGSAAICDSYAEAYPEITEMPPALSIPTIREKHQPILDHYNSYYMY